MNDPIQLLTEHGQNAPFMIGAVAAGAQQINKTRVVEAVITAGVSGAIIAAAGYFIALPVMQEQLIQVRTQISEVKTDVKELRTEIKGDRLLTASDLRTTNDRMQRMEIENARRGGKK